MKHTKILYCKQCSRNTENKICGFGTAGGLVGNKRYECKICNEERI